MIRQKMLALAVGVPPNTLGYQQCLANAVNSPAARAYTDAPRAAAIVDEYGRRYDRYGNRLDQHGYLMMTPVRYITAP